MSLIGGHYTLKQQYLKYTKTEKMRRGEIIKIMVKNDNQVMHICRNTIQGLLLIFLAVFIIFASITPCFAADYNVDLNYSLAVNNKLQTGKSFNADITLFGRGNVAAVIFTVCFDSSVMEFKSAQISDGVSGKLKANCSEDQVAIVYLNTNGQELNADGTSLINLKFKALSKPCTAFMTIYGEQAVSAQEQRLSCEFGVEYSVELMDKISGEVSLAGGSSVKKTSSNSSSKRANSKSSSSKTFLKPGDAKQNGSTSYNSQPNSSFGSQTSAESNNVMFIFGFVVALCVVSAVAGIYAFGKKRGEMKLAQEFADNNISKTDFASKNDFDLHNEADEEGKEDN